MQKLRIKYLLLLGLITLIGVISVSGLARKTSAKSEPSLSYNLPSPEKWKQDFSVGFLSSRNKNYHFQGADEIDLAILPVDDDLYSSFKERGEKSFIEDIRIGKNTINKMLGADEASLAKPKFTYGERAVEIEFEVSQRLANQNLKSIEKYVLYPQRGYIFRLRWSKAAPLDKVKAAQSLFSQITTVENVE